VGWFLGILTPSHVSDIELSTTVPSIVRGVWANKKDEFIVKNSIIRIFFNLTIVYIDDQILCRNRHIIQINIIFIKYLLKIESVFRRLPFYLTKCLNSYIKRIV